MLEKKSLNEIPCSICKELFVVGEYVVLGDPKFGIAHRDCIVAVMEAENILEEINYGEKLK